MKRSGNEFSQYYKKPAGSELSSALLANLLQLPKGNSQQLRQDPDSSFIILTILMLLALLSKLLKLPYNATKVITEVIPYLSVDLTRYGAGIAIKARKNPNNHALTRSIAFTSEIVLVPTFYLLNLAVPVTRALTSPLKNVRLAYAYGSALQTSNANSIAISMGALSFITTLTLGGITLYNLPPIAPVIIGAISVAALAGDGLNTIISKIKFSLNTSAQSKRGQSHHFSSAVPNSDALRRWLTEMLEKSELAHVASQNALAQVEATGNRVTNNDAIPKELSEKDLEESSLNKDDDLSRAFKNF